MDPKKKGRIAGKAAVRPAIEITCGDRKIVFSEQNLKRLGELIKTQMHEKPEDFFFLKHGSPSYMTKLLVDKLYDSLGKLLEGGLRD